MLCSNCGTELLPGKQFCHACGTRATLTCPNCNASVEIGFHFCPDCGFQLESAPGDPKPAANDQLARLSRSMPEGMVEKIQASKSVIEGERKQVTVLFCDLAGSTAVAGELDPEEYHDLLDQYLALTFHEIYRFEGIVNQLAGDGLMALFGAPIAHEDAPQRAVRAALAIRDALAHFNEQLQSERGLALPARIGLNTGPVVVGTVGNDLKMDYTAIGDTTNLASRLESLAAPGAVLVSESTARLVRGFFRMRPMGPLQVKGKSEPVAAYEVIEVADATTPMAVAAARGLTPLVGRDEELAQLEACFSRLAGNLAQVVCVVGDAGSGKSRLLHEFKQRLRDAPVVFFEGRCSALNQMEPYYPFVTMLRQYFELTPGEADDVACEKVARKVQASPDHLGATYPLLCRMLSVSAEGIGDLPPDELKRETLDAVATLVIGTSRQQPAVMVIEDLHWIDEPSRELLEMAVSRLARARVMLLVSHRPDYRPSWRTSAAVTQLSLRPLFDDEIRQIMGALAGNRLPVEIEQLILAKAEGSPFFAEEITRALMEEGYLTCGEDGRCELTRPMDEIRIPGTVQEVLAARLDRLSPAAKRVAQVAAVLGRQFSRSQLERLLGMEGVDVGRELAELEQRGVIHRKNMFSDAEYRFGESLTQEVAYESLLLKQRRQLHEQVGFMLEAGGSDGPLERPARIAHHFARSDNREKAIEAILRAAQDAERVPSYRTAIDFYRQAWEIADAALGERGSTDQRLRGWLVEATLGYSRMTVLYSSSDDAEAARAAQRGRAMAEELGDARSVASFYAYEGMILTSSRERFSEGIVLVEKGIAVAEQLGAEVAVISMSRALAWNYMLGGQFDLAQRKIDWAVQELERLGQRDELTDLYLGARRMQEGIRFWSGDLDGSARAVTETYELSLRASNRTIESLASSALAQIHIARGEYEEARRWADRGLDIAEAIGNVSGIRFGSILALAARVELNEPPNLSRYLEPIEQGLLSGGNMLLGIDLAVEALLTLGDLKRADRLARIAHERAAGPFREMLSLAAMADVAVRLGPASWPDAERWYLQAKSLAETLGVQSNLAVTEIGLGKLALVRGDLDTAASHLEQAVKLCQEVGAVRYRSRAERLLEEVGNQRGERRAPQAESSNPTSEQRTETSESW